jgi:hypothetical protein
VWTHSSISFTYSLKRERERKQRKEDGRKSRVKSGDNCIFAKAENREKVRPLSRAVPELQQLRDASGDGKHLCVASQRSDGKPVG